MTISGAGHDTKGHDDDLTGGPAPRPGAMVSVRDGGLTLGEGGRSVHRIAAWSGPRNLSTALMRAWENRPDTVVLDEPFYAASLAASGIDHPLRDEILAAGPVELDQAIAACLAPPPDHATISYQKHMAHHLLPEVDRSWLAGLDHLLVIRDPRRVLASYARVWPDATVAAIGLPQQLELAERAAMIIDSSEFLTDPRGYLVAICGRFGVAFDESMMAWPAGRRDSDGVWAPAWYGAVEASTGFGPPPGNERVVLPAELEPVAAEADAIYRELHAARFVLDGRERSRLDWRPRRALQAVTDDVVSPAAAVMVAVRPGR